MALAIAGLTRRAVERAMQHLNVGEVARDERREAVGKMPGVGFVGTQGAAPTIAIEIRTASRVMSAPVLARIEPLRQHIDC
jgi:hypothetical protein